jgi:hypothetical protein
MSIKWMGCCNHSNSNSITQNEKPRETLLQLTTVNCETQQYQVGIAPYNPHPQQKVQKLFIYGGLNHSRKQSK